MPRLYRSMKRAEDDRPVVEPTNQGLGVRGGLDVDLDGEGRVVLNDKGMSVNRDIKSIYYLFVPERLNDRFRRARGGSELSIFAIGEGPFADAPINPALAFVKDKATHGVVVPRASVSLNDYQADLAATRDSWTIDEA